MVARYVIVHDAKKLVFKLTDSGVVRTHLLIGAIPVFIQLVGDQRGVTIDHQALDTELASDA